MQNIKYLGLMAFEPKLHGEALKTVGCDKLESISLGNQKDMPKVTDGKVTNMPVAKDNTIYVANIHVYEAVKGFRDDVIMFDDKHDIRDESGRVISRGGFLNE